MSELDSQFTGRSGHLAVMAEFLHRGINVAIPEVDVGDDIFVVRGADELVTRVQVKSANGVEQQDGSYFAQFKVPWGQLSAADEPALVYVLAVRCRDRWSDFIVIRRDVLKSLQEDFGAGSRVRGKNGRTVSLMLRLVFTADDVLNKKVSFQAYRAAFEPWPPPDP